MFFLVFGGQTSQCRVQGFTPNELNTGIPC